MEEDFEWPEPPKGDMTDGSSRAFFDSVKKMFGKGSHSSISKKEKKE